MCSRKKGYKWTVNEATFNWSSTPRRLIQTYFEDSPLLEIDRSLDDMDACYLLSRGSILRNFHALVISHLNYVNTLYGSLSLKIARRIGLEYSCQNFNWHNLTKAVFYQHYKRQSTGCFWALETDSASEDVWNPNSLGILEGIASVWFCLLEVKWMKTKQCSGVWDPWHCF